MYTGKGRTLRNKKLSIAVIAWDVTHNALGRAYMLADALSAKYEVKIYGFCFNNKPVWSPLKKGSIPVISFPGSYFPEFTRLLETVAQEIRADIVIVSKLRLPSLQLGLLWKASNNRPLILDIDDYEIAFFKDKLQGSNQKDIIMPQGEIWTRYCDYLVEYVDHILVSNSALKNKYGGTIIPHARNEKIFNPSLYSKEKRKKELGILTNDRIILFLGTPKKHKGLTELLKAIKKIGNPNYKLCVMGSFVNNNLKKELKRIGEHYLILFPDQPFVDIARNIIVADLVCLLQDQESEVSRYQLPAKAIDAISMGIPVLSTRTPPMETLIEKGLVIPTSHSSLNEDIKKTLSNIEIMQKKQFANRSIFLNEYSYGAISEQLERVIIKCVENSKPLQEKALNFIKIQTDVLDDVKKLMETERACNVDIMDKVNKVDTEMKKLKLDYKSIKIEKRKLEKRYKTILKSRTWRYTEPLRKIARLLTSNVNN